MSNEPRDRERVGRALDFLDSIRGPDSLAVVRVGIIGAGYVGQALAGQLAAAGHEVIVARRTVPRTATEHPSIALRSADLDDPESVRAALDGVDRVVHLAPPPRDGEVEDQAARFARSLPPGCDRVVYGSTTGVYSPPADPQEWIDEESPVAPAGAGGRARLTYERALMDHCPGPVFRVRIAAIYGPGRTLADRLQKGQLVLFREGPETSRIHRDDLARLFLAMTTAVAPPPLILACDERPATTLEVATFTAERLGWALPEVLSREEAAEVLSARGRELRFNGKRCRSLLRSSLIGALDYPTYREGVAAALEGMASGRRDC